ncbi:MAG: hypothetical protein KC897_00485 [Candidatus Omnitrophica bacterium]|nr:hypothetical protein [Candidatus Omnitrophota bacterium]MCB9721517.1 hypothetical protein [Candidatus Omnitrophota bacterium]
MRSRWVIVAMLLAVTAAGMLMANGRRTDAEEFNHADQVCADFVSQQGLDIAMAKAVLALTEGTVRHCERDEDCAVVMVPCGEFTAVNQEFRQCYEKAADQYGAVLDCAGPLTAVPEPVCDAGVCGLKVAE